jgi:putative nucleotidyltransferase with HDIG domain
MNTEKVIELWEKQGFNENLKQHSIRVSAIALFITDKFIEEGEAIDKELVKYGALLHDIGKMHNISGRDNGAHNHIGRDILLKEGYPKIAEIAHEHFVDFIIDLNFTSKESEIVAIADNLVNPDGFATFDERMEYGRKVNPQFIPVFDKGQKELKNYFKKLFDNKKNFRKIAKNLTKKLDFSKKTYKELIEEL